MVGMPRKSVEPPDSGEREGQLWPPSLPPKQPKFMLHLPSSSPPAPQPPS